MPISNVFIYIFTAIEIGFTQSQQLVGLLHFWITLVLLAYSLGGGGVWRVSHLLSTKTAKFL